MHVTRTRRDSAKASLLDASPRHLAWRRAKVGWLQARRLATWAIDQARGETTWRRPEVVTDPAELPHLLYSCAIPLRRDDRSVDPLLDRSKRHNIALAAPYFDGLVIAPDRPFSFWRSLGRITRARGFRHGMEVRGGCIVPALGGGICLLSNALFRMASELGWTILERHGHTMEAAPPLRSKPSVCRGAPALDADAEPWGMDATVFWPHVDLRFAPASGRARIGATVKDDVLTLVAHADAPMADIDIRLESAGDQVSYQNGARQRRNQVVRHIACRATGRVLGRDVIAENRKRLLESEEQRRNCLTCQERGCSARPREVGQLIELRARIESKRSAA